MHRGGTGLVALMVLLLLSLIPDALAVELERMQEMQESHDSKLRAHQKRITAIEAKGRGDPADPEKRADRITRDRIAEVRAALKGGGGAVNRLMELAEKASADAKASLGVYRGQSEHIDVVAGEWGARGAERKRLSDAITALQRSLALTSASLALAAEAAGAMQSRVQQSGVLEKVAKIEAAASEVPERLGARWERERAAREREREQRERDAGARARGLR